ncbi:MAG: hypothetical protein NVSMB66_6240 [Candidatus Doudnabacteria bacterium]
MSTAVLIDGGAASIPSNQASPATYNYYFAFAHGTKPGAYRGASLGIDAITGGNCTIQFSNDTLTDSGAAAGTDEYNATAAQLNSLTWDDRTARFSAGATATITATQVVEFDTTISFRFMRVQFNTTNATNSLALRFHRN